MAKTIKVKNLEEALSLANKFKSSGKYNLFRGQAQNWPVLPSLGRVSKRKIKEAEDKIERLYYFFGIQPALKKYRENIDWFFAVAQHYGLPTQYIDFTNSVEVAAFFATNSKANEIGEECVIICLNEERLNSLVDFTKIIHTKYDVTFPYITKPNVDNLWRLQAQQGCFLFTPYMNIEELYSFDKIVFPFREPFTKLSKYEVYPDRKSELEILLDQYFTSERKHGGFERLKLFAKEMNIPIKTIPSQDHKIAIKKNSRHHTWRSAYFKTWNYQFKEKWNDYRDGTNLVRLQVQPAEDISIQVDSVSNQLFLFLEANKVKRTTFLQFEVVAKPKLPKKLAQVINRSCTRIWDGARNLPYTDVEIAYIISKYICLEIYGSKFDHVPSLSGESVITLRMINRYGSNTKCEVSASKVAAAFRSDIQEIVIDGLAKNISSEILFHINIPSLVFDFKRLVQLFKEEMIVNQVLNSNKTGDPLIFYTPAQVAKLGYA